MTDLEISKALALAIGYLPEHIKVSDEEYLEVYRPASDLQLQHPHAYAFKWGYFSYSDWNVIGPLAKRYDAFPQYVRIGAASYWTAAIYGGTWEDADTPQKAIALAVIEGAKK